MLILCRSFWGTCLAILTAATVQAQYSQPLLKYSTYLGGDSDDSITAACADAFGNTVFAGFGNSLDFPDVSAGELPFDVYSFLFVRKLGPTGRLLWQRVIARGTVQALACDVRGDVYAAGSAVGAGFSTTPGALQPSVPASGAGPRSAFLMKLDGRSGAIRYATYLGAGTNATAYGVVVNASGEAYVTGDANVVQPAIPRFPTTPGAPASSAGGAFLAKVNADGTALLYSAVLGGSGTSVGSKVTLDPSGSPWMTGFTAAPDFPVSAAPLQPTYPIHTYYRSSDGGRHWIALDTLPGSVNAIQVSPVDRRLCYAASTLGVFRSTDQGLTWTRRSATATRLLTLSPLDPQLLYAMIGNALSISHDGGVTWDIAASAQVIFTERVSALMFDANDPYSLLVGSDTALFSATDTPGVLAIRRILALPARSLQFDRSTSPATLLINSGFGAYRVVLSTGESTELRLFSYGPLTTLTASVGPSPVYYATNVSPLDGNPYIAVKRSLDRGVTWSDANAGLPSGLAQFLVTDPHLPHTVYVEMPNGLYRSDDDGVHWQFADQSLGNPRIQAFAVDLDPNASVQYAAATAANTGFLAKLDPARGELQFSTYLGKSGGEPAGGLAIDADGRVHVSGTSYSNDFYATDRLPGTGPHPYHCYVLRLAPGAAALEASTLFGGTGLDGCGTLQLGHRGDLYLTGSTTSVDLPVTPGAPQTNFGGGSSDGFLVQLTTSGRQLRFGTYVGGSGTDGVNTFALTPNDQIRLGGFTTSRDLPISRAADSYHLGFRGAETTDGFLWFLQPPTAAPDDVHRGH